MIKQQREDIFNQLYSFLNTYFEKKIFNNKLRVFTYVWPVFIYLFKTIGSSSITWDSQHSYHNMLTETYLFVKYLIEIIFEVIKIQRQFTLCKLHTPTTSTPWITVKTWMHYTPKLYLSSSHITHGDTTRNYTGPCHIKWSVCPIKNVEFNNKVWKWLFVVMYVYFYGYIE